MPQAPGVYLFYSEQNNLPLYIGKSVSLRQRVLSHFQADHSNPKEFKLAQQVERVEFIPTAGELSALLLESKLIKSHMPLYNRKLRRKKTLVGFKLKKNQLGYLEISVARELDDSEESSAFYGSYRSVVAAQKSLLALVKEHQLCPKLCGLEQKKSVCFSFWLKRCKGACIQNESVDTYNTRVRDALAYLKEEVWPFKGAIAIKEECPINKITQFMKFNQWRYLGFVTELGELNTLQDNKKVHDLDTYRILLSFMKHQLKPEQTILCVH